MAVNVMERDWSKLNPRPAKNIDKVVISENTKEKLDNLMSSKPDMEHPMDVNVSERTEEKLKSLMLPKPDMEHPMEVNVSEHTRSKLDDLMPPKPDMDNPIKVDVQAARAAAAAAIAPSVTTGAQATMQLGD